MPEAKRLALVIGCGSYDDQSLQPLAATREDISGLEGALLNEDICYFTSCKALVDCEKNVVEKAIQNLRDAAFDDTVLLYLSGHGIKDDQGSLYFAQRDTEPDMLEASAVSAEFIRRQMDKCNSQRKILILDCCFAGAFPKGSKGAAGALELERQLASELPPGRGFFIISAAGEFQYAYSEGKFEQASESKPQPSLFTRHLVNGLVTGEADTDQNGIIKVGELFQYLQRKVAQERPEQTPKMFADVEEDFVIAVAARKKGENITWTLETDPTEAAVGGRRSYSFEGRGSVDVVLPAGSKDGDEIVVPGMGSPGENGAPPGDLILRVAGATRQPVAGEDLRQEVTVSGEEAESGLAMTVKYQFGEISLQIPPNTKDGQILKVPGKGMPGKWGGETGSLYVAVNVNYIPVPGKDFEAELSLMPEEAVAGCLKDIATPVDPHFRFLVPSGTPNGFRFPAIKGLGYAGKFGGAAGDLFVTVKIEFEKPADDTFTLELTEDEVRTGAVKIVSGPFGRFEHMVAEGAQPGEVVRLPGKGTQKVFGGPASDVVITYLVKGKAPAVKDGSAPVAPPQMLSGSPATLPPYSSSEPIPTPIPSPIAKPPVNVNAISDSTAAPEMVEPATTPEESVEQRDAFVDYARVGLAFLIATFYGPTMLRWGDLVFAPAFFALSGYYVLQSRESCGTFGEFVKRRALRILPVFVAGLILSFALNFDHMGTAWEHTKAYFGISSEFGGDGSAWVFDKTILSYAILAGLFALGAYRKSWSIWTAFGISLCATIYFWKRQYALDGFRELVDWIRPSSIWLAFFAGSLVYLYRDRLRLGALTVAAAFLMLVGTYWFMGALSWSWLTGPLFGLALLALRGVRLPRVPNLSYGIFIYHLPLYLFVVIHKEWSFYAYLAILLAVCVASYYGIERPFLRLKDRRAATG